jgi:RND family efflux transporter MFP subunit
MTRHHLPVHLPILVVLASAAAGGAACGRQSAGQAAQAERPPVAVAVSAAGVADFTETVEVVGSLAPKFAADVKSEISGLVTAVYVTEWVPVRRGDRLARLDTSETEAAIQALRAGEAQARTAETRARREYERAQQLKQYGLITPQNFDDAATAVEAAEAVTAAAQAQVRAAEARLAKAFLKAPIDGIVALRAVNVGDRVENMGGNAPLFRIVDNRLLELTVTVPSSRAALVAVGQPIEFSTDTLPERAFTGKVMFINPAMDEASRGAKVIAEVPNRDGTLRGGAFVKGRIHVATRTGVLQVPREALLNWNVEAATADVFVVRENRADRRTVRLGRAAGGQVEVTEGLQPGDPVVTRGAFALRPGDRVSIAAGEGA